MRTILFVLAFLLAPFSAHAQGCGPSNPQCIVTTAAPGTSNNQAASTAFVSSAVFGHVNSQTGNYTIAATDCGSTIQAGTGSTGFFTVTVPSATGFANTCVVMIVDGDTARGKAISNDPGCSTVSILWPLQACMIGIVNGAWAVLSSPGRWRPTSAITFHVNSSTGSDSNNDCLSTTTGACATANHAMSLISSQVDNLSGVTIQWDTNTTANFTALPYVGPGSVTLNGNSTTMNVATAAGGANIVIGGEGTPVGGTWTIENFTLQSNTNAGIYGIVCFYGAQCALGSGMTFVGIGGGVTFPGSVIAAGFGSNFKCSSFTVNNNWSVVLEADDFGRIDCSSVTVTFTGTPFFNTATVTSHGAGAIVSIPSITWSGSVTAGIKRYNANLLALIDSGACASIPGSVAGTPAPDTLGSDGAYCN